MHKSFVERHKETLLYGKGADAGFRLSSHHVEIRLGCLIAYGIIEPDDVGENVLGTSPLEVTKMSKEIKLSGGLVSVFEAVIKKGDTYIDCEFLVTQYVRELGVPMTPFMVISHNSRTLQLFNSKVSYLLYLSLLKFIFIDYN